MLRTINQISANDETRHTLRTRESLPAILTTFPHTSPRLQDAVDNTSDRDSRSPDTTAGRRQRRRIDRDGTSPTLHHSPHSSSTPASAAVPIEGSRQGTESQYSNILFSPRSSSSHRDYFFSSSLPRRNSSVSTNSSSDDDFAGAVGQLSLNEDEEVRYHGKASGLHLLGAKDRLDRRNEGGIWRFPKARVWPPLPPGPVSGFHEDEEGMSKLPPTAIQEHLLDLYFTYVHPSLPVVHKQTFFEGITVG